MFVTARKATHFSLSTQVFVKRQVSGCSKKFALARPAAECERTLQNALVSYVNGSCIVKKVTTRYNQVHGEKLQSGNVNYMGLILYNASN